MLAMPLCSRADTKPWNIVLILADDLGWADLPAYGGDFHETPNLDRFAKDAVRFTQAYAASPVCSPTRASLMTGKSPARLGMTTWVESAMAPPHHRRLLPPASRENLPLTERTLAKALRSGGYATAHVGKWHLGTAGYYPEAQGFDINIGGTLWGAPQTYFYPYTGSKHYGGEFRYIPHLEWGVPGEYLTDRLTDEALNVINHLQEGPFFLNLWHYAVHTPVESKPGLLHDFERKRKPGYKHRNAGYAGMIKSLDESVGRVLKHLDDTGLADRTVVIFASDNGGYTEPFDNQPVTTNAPLRSGKGSLYEGGIRVPLMVRWPGVTPLGAVCDVPVISTDLYRTMLEIAGISSNDASQDGMSLTPLFKNPSRSFPRTELFFHYPHYYPTTTPVSAVRSGDWKLLEYFEDGRLELYNIKEDLSETNNLALQMPDLSAGLHAKLRKWRHETGAKLPTPNPDYGTSSEAGQISEEPRLYGE
jgi:arylsulfatase A-like enzyme